MNNILIKMIIFTRNGQAISLLIPREGVDLETLSLSLNPQFLNIIESARKSQQEEGRIMLEDVRQQILGL